MKAWKRIGSLFMGALVISACSAVPEPDLRSDDVENDHDALYAASNTLWQTRQIPVCWENPSEGDEIYRAWVQESVTNTWDAVSSIDFVGWGPCGGGDEGIRINIEDAGPHTKGLGASLNGVPAGMVLNFTFQNWSPSCQGMLESCIRSIAVHEFGHALGFAHEQNRDDTPGKDVCDQEPQGTDGDFVIGSWDLYSVMNYCNPAYNGDGNLSQTDIDGIRLLYDVGMDGLIINQFDDKCMEVAGGSYDDGAPVVASPCSGDDSQRWDLVPVADGLYNIVNRKSGKCLDVVGADFENGAMVGQWSCAAVDNQTWIADSTGGVTGLIAKHSGKCLDLADYSQADGARIHQWDCHGDENQRWELKK